MILVLMTLTVYFCHSIICLIMVSRRIDALHNGRRGHNRLRFTGYVVPREPIPITLARDEEMAVGQEMAERHVAVPPPAYGNWRSSIVRFPQDYRSGIVNALIRRATVAYLYRICTNHFSTANQS